MKTTQQISQTVDAWIDEQDLPVRASLKVIRGFNPYDGMDEDEIVAYRDFMFWALTREHEVLFSIPKPENEYDFWHIEVDEFGVDSSAFNTVDFQKRLKPFNKYGYAIQKILERVKNLALLHSAISSQIGRQNTYNRYIAFVNDKFRNQLINLVERYKNPASEYERNLIRQKIGQLNQRIIECKKIWERCAPIEKRDV